MPDEKVIQEGLTMGGWVVNAGWSKLEFQSDMRERLLFYQTTYNVIAALRTGDNLVAGVEKRSVEKKFWVLLQAGRLLCG